MKSRAEILSVKQNIINVGKKKSRHIGIIMPSVCAVIIVTILVCLSIESVGVMQVASSMYHVYNPVNSLYSDNSSLIFASTSISQNNIDFSVPIVTNKSEILSSGDVIFQVVNSIMVRSIENGIIEDIGITNDGIKYIKIMHSVDIKSYIENVDIVGVSQYDRVKKGQEIATAKVGENIRLKIIVNGEQIQNLKINQSKIIWKE